MFIADRQSQTRDEVAGSEEKPISPYKTFIYISLWMFCGVRFLNTVDFLRDLVQYNAASGARLTVNAAWRELVRFETICAGGAED
jgi:hypothetical protein